MKKRVEREEALSPNKRHRPEDVLVPPLATDASMHRVGAIVRMKLVNFMSYTDTEFFPGPWMNVVLGPNGTGKSSIVCAIAVGLNTSIATIGRAKELKDFVKLGEEKGSVEIELAHGSRNGNLIIKRTIDRSNSSEWRLNGKPATLKDVQKKIDALHIQTENACHFLVQENVVTFAQLTPEKLLQETEKAAGKMGMFEAHMELVKLNNEFHDIHLKAGQEKQRLEDLKEQNKTLERDVIRFRQREQILSSIKVMERKRPWMVYEQQKVLVQEAEERAKDCKERVEEFKKTLAPIESELNDVEANVAAIDQMRRQATQELKGLDRNREKVNLELQRLEDDHLTLLDAKSRIVTGAAKQKERVKKLEKTVEKLRQELDEAEDTPLDMRRMQEIRETLTECNRTRTQLRQQESDLKVNAHRKGSELRTAYEELRAIESVKQARSENFLRTVARDKFSRDKVKQFMTWLNSNRNIFEREVFGPIVLEVDVEQQEYAILLENQIPKWLQKSMVAQTDRDADTLRKIITKVGAPLSVTNIAHVDRRILDLPVDPAKLRSLGFYGYLLDTINCAEPVRISLSCNANLSKVPFGPARDPEALNNVLQELIRLYQEKGMSMVEFYTPTTKYISKQSSFGHRDRSTRAQQLHAARIIRGVNEERKNELKAAIANLHTEEEEIQREQRELSQQLKNIDQQEAQLKNERNKLSVESKRTASIKQKLDLAERELAGAQKDTDPEASLEVEDKKIQKNIERRGLLMRKMIDIWKKLVENNANRDLAQLKRSVASQRLQDLQVRHQEALRAGKEVERAFNMANVELNTQKQRAVELLRTAKESGRLRDEDRAEFEKYPSTLRELDDMLTEYRAKADATTRANPKIVEEYEKRCAEIQKLEDMMANRDSRLNTMKEEIESKKGEWLPSIADLVARIDKHFVEYFDRIGCSGRVKLAVHEDFEKYGIEIQVSFRVNQPLRVLDASTQSGGERSVTTMLYLLALQEITLCPFRLVDEINQGMDPTNERMIFSEAGEACTQGKPQFFLITPKLLPALQFKEHMTILNIMNGPWNVNQDQWNASIQ